MVVLAAAGVMLRADSGDTQAPQREPHRGTFPAYPSRPDPRSKLQDENNHSPGTRRFYNGYLRLALLSSLQLQAPREQHVSFPALLQSLVSARGRELKLGGTLQAPFHGTSFYLT